MRKVHVKLELDVLIVANDEVTDVANRLADCEISIDNQQNADVMEIQDVTVVDTFVTDSR